VLEEYYARSSKDRAKAHGVTALVAPQCLGCGACCFSKLETYASVTGFDYARLGDCADDLTVFVGNRCYMRMLDGHCASLVVDRATRRFVCSVYETRPAVCRDLARSSPACQGEIYEKGERPGALLHVLEARQAQTK
jgi:hypothetical protein